VATEETNLQKKKETALNAEAPFETMLPTRSQKYLKTWFLFIARLPFKYYHIVLTALLLAALIPALLPASHIVTVILTLGIALGLAKAGLAGVGLSIAIGFAAFLSGLVYFGLLEMAFHVVPKLSFQTLSKVVPYIAPVVFAALLLAIFISLTLPTTHIATAILSLGIVLLFPHIGLAGGGVGSIIAVGAAVFVGGLVLFGLMQTCWQIVKCIIGLSKNVKHIEETITGHTYVSDFMSQLYHCPNSDSPVIVEDKNVQYAEYRKASVSTATTDLSCPLVNTNPDDLQGVSTSPAGELSPSS